MPFQPVANTMECTFEYVRNDNAHRPQNTLYFRRDDGWNATTITSLLEDAAAAFGGSVLNDTYMPSEAQMIRVLGRDLENEFAPTIQNSDSVAGASVLDFSPPNCAVLVTFHPTPSGPPRRGGIFWPYVRELDVTEAGRLDAAAGAAIRDAWEAIASAIMLGNACEHVIVSRFETVDDEQVARTPALTALVGSYGYKAVIASQRDRRPAI